MTALLHRRYAEFVKNYSDRPAFAEFMGSKERKLFFAQTITAAPEGFEQWWRDLIRFEAGTGAKAIPVGTYDGNRLQLACHTAGAGYLIFTDNWDQDWRATLNGKPVPIERAFGTFKAVHIANAGDGVVTFEYAPRPRWWWMALLGLALTIAVIALEMVRRRGGPPVSENEQAVRNRTPESS